MDGSDDPRPPGECVRWSLNPRGEASRGIPVRAELLLSAVDVGARRVGAVGRFRAVSLAWDSGMETALELQVRSTTCSSWPGE